ncbi:MAG TPA: squalene--hopene cyclase [Candidatus Limnocylindria bacterium]|nr:squalene--hopene cyclase [Candidatus Limnocylindria bacterium]
MSITVGTELDRTLDAGVERLLAIQKPGGWWVGELESNVTMTAQHLFLHEFLRIGDEDTTRRCANELLARRNGEGLWAIYWGGEPDLAATLESYAALRMAGLSADDPRLEPARSFCEKRGGIGAARVFTRIWLALFGLWRWEEIQAIPPELVLLRPELPLSVYDFGCWARQTMVALSVVMHHRPVRRLPEERLCRELDLGPAPRPRTAWNLLDAAVRRYTGASFQPGRERALAYAERWIVDRQELDGSWGGIQPPWVWSLIALACRGHGPESPYLQRGLEGWRRFLVEEGDRLRPEACQSPVWDTGLAVLALRNAGVPAEEPALQRAAEWLLQEEVRARGDWAVRLPGAESGGWAFEYDNDLYPDIDDAAVIAIALNEMGTGRPAVERACRWVAAMQSSNGGWGAFDVDNDAHWLYDIPFFDFGAVIDPPSVDVSGHAVELLAREPGYEDVVRRGVDYLLREQEPDGAWFGRWGVNYVYGAGAALPALEAAGFPPSHPVVRRAVGWLESVQNDDGGFGEDCRSYDPGEEGRAWRGRGVSTPSQTAWALLGLVAAGEARSEAVARAAGWLAETQRDDGDWDEDYFTGTGFPRDFLINYHLYRTYWPVMALGRLKAALS